MEKKNFFQTSIIIFFIKKLVLKISFLAENQFYKVA